MRVTAITVSRTNGCVATGTQTLAMWKHSGSKKGQSAASFCAIPRMFGRGRGFEVSEMLVDSRLFNARTVRQHGPPTNDLGHGAARVPARPCGTTTRFEASSKCTHVIRSVDMPTVGKKFENSNFNTAKPDLKISASFHFEGL